MAKCVVVRSHLAGVHFGRLVRREGDRVVLREARRAWSWQGALSVSELAVRGPGKGSKICVTVARVVVFGAIEIIDTTEAARVAWKAAPEATT
jgi:hypothetical protein